MDFGKDFTIPNICIDNIGSPSALDLFACRVCLATDIKLFDIHECDLAESFEAVMGIAVPPDDGLPQHLCHYCFALLQKYTSFREKYNRSHIILQTVALLGQPITTDYLRIIDRDAEQLAVPLSIHDTGFIDYEIIEDPDECGIPEEYTFEEQDIDSKADIKPVIFEIKKDEMPDVIDSETVLEQDYIVADQEMVALEGCTYVEDVKIEELMEKPKPLRMAEHPNIRVVTLTHEEQVAEVRARSKSTLYLSALHKCDKCYKGFLNSNTFRNHMADHHPSAGPVECPVCEIRVPTGAKLRVHIADEHQRRFICRLCDHQAPTCHRALKHQKIHDGVVYDCKYCGKTFQKASQCMWHSRRAHPVIQICETCGERCDTRKELAKHRLSHHQEPTTPNTETWLYCTSCDVEFRGVNALTKHLVTASAHTQEDSGLNYFCKHCGDSFTTEESLDEHKIEHVSEMYKCPECDAYCETESSLLHHCDTEHPAATPGELMCELCGRKLTTVGGLVAHRRTHSMEKPFKCPYCQKAFRFPQYLQIHVRTHTGEKPYICNVCSMAFQAKANLNRHLKVHTGEKPYMCDLCGKSFTQSNSMKVHVKTVHLKLPDPYKDRRKGYRTRNKSDKDDNDDGTGQKMIVFD